MLQDPSLVRRLHMRDVGHAQPVPFCERVRVDTTRINTHQGGQYNQ